MCSQQGASHVVKNGSPTNRMQMNQKALKFTNDMCPDVFSSFRSHLFLAYYKAALVNITATKLRNIVWC